MQIPVDTLTEPIEKLAYRKSQNFSRVAWMDTSC